MNSFKISKKETHTDSRMSLIAKHNQTIEYYEKEKEKLPEYIKKLDFLKNMKETKIINKQHSNEINKIRDEISKLEEQIIRLKNDTDLSEYLFKSVEFINKLDTLDFTETENNSNSDIFNFISVKCEKRSEDIYKEYMTKCFPEECSNMYTFKKATCGCKECGGDTINDISAGIKICNNCGLTEPYTSSGLPEWNTTETHDFVKPYSYKRTNHFKEWIVQIQGREGTFVPKQVIDLLLIEIKKERLTDKSMITYHKIKEYLKKLKLNKYYEHIPNIIHKITGNVQLVINQKLEEKLLEMFNDIQEPFEKYCPKNRKNFLSYSYTLYKFFQLLKKDEYLIYFPLLKSREKLFEQEQIWKQICNELDWEFIKCI